jgi:hypothetical protein
MHIKVRSLNCVWIVLWILLSVSKSTDALLYDSINQPNTQNELALAFTGIYVRGLVEDDHARAFDQCARETEETPFADAQVLPVGLDGTVKRESVSVLPR